MGLWVMAHFNTCIAFTHPWSYNCSILFGNSHTTSFPSSPCGNQHNKNKTPTLFCPSPFYWSTWTTLFFIDHVVLRNTTTLKMNNTYSSIDHISHILENGQKSKRAATLTIQHGTHNSTLLIHEILHSPRLPLHRSTRPTHENKIASYYLLLIS